MTKNCTHYEMFHTIQRFMTHYTNKNGSNPRIELCKNKTSERLVVVFDYGKKG